MGPFEKIISNVCLSCALKVFFSQEGSKIVLWLRAALESLYRVYHWSSVQCECSDICKVILFVIPSRMCGCGCVYSAGFQCIYREVCIHVCVYFGTICVCVGLVPLQVSKIKDNGMLERVRPRSSGLSHSEHGHFVQWTPCPEIQMCDISKYCLTNGQFGC
jgi:hypothetical protein